MRDHEVSMISIQPKLFLVLFHHCRQINYRFAQNIPIRQYKIMRGYIVASFQNCDKVSFNFSSTLCSSPLIGRYMNCRESYLIHRPMKQHLYTEHCLCHTSRFKDVHIPRQLQCRSGRVLILRFQPSRHAER